MQTPALEGIGWPPPQLRLLPSSDAFRSSKIWGPPTWFGAPRASTVSLSTYHCHQLLPPRCEVTGTMGESEVESGWCFHLAGESSIQWDVHLNIHDIHWVRDSIGVFFPMDRWSDWWFQTWILCSTIYGMSSFPLTNSYFSRWLLHHQAAIHVMKNVCLESCDVAFHQAIFENLPMIPMIPMIWGRAGNK